MIKTAMIFARSSGARCRGGLRLASSPEGSVIEGFVLIEMVSTDEPGAAGLTEIRPGANWQLIPRRAEQDRLTCPWKLFTEFTCTLKFSDPPTEIVAEVAETLPVNVPPAISSWAEALCVTGPAVPITVKSYIPGTAFWV